jgi:NADH-quinone oxidoreductase subunit E
MLTEEEKGKIREAIRKSERKREAALDALRIVQSHRRWVSDELKDVAQMLEMTPVELDSIATFYSQIFRRPVGKHVITICDSASCWITGYADLIDHLMSTLGIGLGETTADEQFTLLPAACLGACEQAPAMMIDDVLYGNLSRERINEILERYR